MAAPTLYYMATVRAREREHLPVTGPGIDRRSLAIVHKLCSSQHVESLVCPVCTQVHTRAACWERMFRARDPAHCSARFADWDPGLIKRYKVRDSLHAPMRALPQGIANKDLPAWKKQCLLSYKLNLLLSEFERRFASAGHGTDGPWRDASCGRATGSGRGRC